MDKGLSTKHVSGRIHGYLADKNDDAVYTNTMLLYARSRRLLHCIPALVRQLTPIAQRSSREVRQQFVFRMAAAASSSATSATSALCTSPKEPHVSYFWREDVWLALHRSCLCAHNLTISALHFLGCAQTGAESAATIRQLFNTAAHNNDVDEALALYRTLPGKGISPSPYVISLLLNLCANAATGQTAPMTTNRKTRRKGELRTPASMLADSASAAAPGGGPTFVREPGSSNLSPQQLLDTAREVMQKALDAADSGEAAVKETSFSSIIRTACGVGQPHVALSYVAEMRKRKTVCKARSFLPIIAAFAEAGDAAGAKCALTAMEDASVPLTEQAYRSMLEAAAARVESGETTLRASVETEVGTCHDDTPAGWREYVHKLLVQMTHDIYQLERSTISAVQRVFAAGGASQGGLPQWATAESAVSADGVFPPNQHQLRSVDLTTQELAELATQARELACTSDRRTSQFKDFEAFLQKAGPIDILIDGANLGFFNQNFAGGAFSHAQIDAAVRHFAAQGLRVAVVLHSKWLSAGTAPQPFKRSRDGSQKRRRDGSSATASDSSAVDAPPAAASGSAAPAAAADAAPMPHALGQQSMLDTYRERWTRMGLLYEVQRGNNDDWYWLYAAVTVKASDGTQRSVRVVSNDQMRDHHFKMLAPENFLKWRERHQVTYHIMSFQKRSTDGLPDDDYSDDEEHHSHANLNKSKNSTEGSTAPAASHGSDTAAQAQQWVQQGSAHLHSAAMAREAEGGSRPEHGDGTCEVQRSYVHCEVQPRVALSSRFNMPGRFSVRLQAGKADGSGGWYMPVAPHDQEEGGPEGGSQWVGVWPKE